MTRSVQNKHNGKDLEYITPTVERTLPAPAYTVNGYFVTKQAFDCRTTPQGKKFKYVIASTDDDIVGFLVTPFHQCLDWCAGMCLNPRCNKWHAQIGCIVTKLPRSRESTVLGVAQLAQTRVAWVSTVMEPTKVYHSLLTTARAEVAQQRADRERQVASVGSDFRPSGGPAILTNSSAKRPRTQRIVVAASAPQRMGRPVVKHEPDNGSPPVVNFTVEEVLRAVRDFTSADLDAVIKGCSELSAKAKANARAEALEAAKRELNELGAKMHKLQAIIASENV